MGKDIAQWFNMQKYTAIAHGKELAKAEGVQQNYYEDQIGRSDD
jgi:hypothetical protein